MRNESDHRNTDVARWLFLIPGVFLLVCAVVFNEFLITWLKPTPPFGKVVIETIRLDQVGFLLAGLSLVLFSELVKRFAKLRSVMNKGLVINITLTLMILVVPLFTLELIFRPAAAWGKSKIYMEDKELGWKLRPGAEDIYKGVKVKINGKGLVGPELEYAKPDDVIRILYLGDSVTFGFRLEGYQSSFPYVAEADLKRESKFPIQTVNAGVSGYDPWQEYTYLINEGIKYDPDIVILSFVLNDVTVLFDLAGTNVSDNEIRSSLLGVSKFNRFSESSGIWFLVKKLRARLGLEDWLESKTEGRHDKSSLFYPDSSFVKRAWRITLDDLDKIQQFCRERNIQFVLSIVPSTYQFESNKRLFAMSVDKASPQKVLMEYAADRNIPVINLLPILSTKMKASNWSLETLFLDSNHFSYLGSRLVGEIIADYLLDNGFVPSMRG